jgi:hypothetical protein
MKILYEITDSSKQNFFSLALYEINDNIEKRANEWFNKTFLEPKDYIPNELLVANLKMDINYLLSKAIWLIKLSESLGYVSDAKRFIEMTYDIYTKDENGYRLLVRNRLYCGYTNKLLTESEANAREKKIKKTMQKLWNEIK